MSAPTVPQPVQAWQATPLPGSSRKCCKFTYDKVECRRGLMEATIYATVLAILGECFYGLICNRGKYGDCNSDIGKMIIITISFGAFSSLISYIFYHRAKREAAGLPTCNCDSIMHL